MLPLHLTEDKGTGQGEPRSQRGKDGDGTSRICWYVVGCNAVAHGWLFISTGGLSSSFPGETFEANFVSCFLGRAAPLDSPLGGVASQSRLHVREIRLSNFWTVVRPPSWAATGARRASEREVSEGATERAREGAVYVRM